ncbi:AI-2E family transporter [Paenibacillus sp. P26]|nr:AI-2E family transporter [Paenibacillus sp. P26]UUZ93545.1 AI-2E family transporter [Paenibacillus sp. P25]
METIRDFFTLPIVRRVVVLLLLVVLLYSLHSMLNMILLLFMVTYIMGRLQIYLTERIRRLFPIQPNVVTILLYILILMATVIGISKYIPQIAAQIVEMFNNIVKFLHFNQGDPISNELAKLLSNIDYNTYLDQAKYYIAKLGEWFEIILIVIILSLFFLLQKSKVAKFTRKFRTSKIGWIYDELEYFSKKFMASFGKVIEVQLIISVVNTAVTMIGLWSLGFPYLFALSVMVLLLSFIPVVGVIVSFVPIGLIGYQTGGWKLVIWSIVLIIFIHALETYVLSPRLMASKTELPMFYTFVVLVIAQHLFGIWGLIIGIPIFMFVLDLLEVNLADDEPY